VFATQETLKILSTHLVDGLIYPRFTKKIPFFLEKPALKYIALETFNTVIVEDYKVYSKKMQTPSGQKEIIERVRGELSFKLKLISIKTHDFLYRKKLIVVGDDNRENYCLMRVKLTFKGKGAVVSKNVIIYPCDVIPYVRKNLAVIEEMVRERLKQEQPCKIAGDIVYEKYNFDINWPR